MGLIRIELFGNLRITCGETPVTSVNTSRLQSLLAYLVLHGDSPQPREQLAFVLWPASSESQARTNLRQLLHHLRRALPAECCLLMADHHTVQWRRDPACTVDVLEFDAAVARGALEEAAQLCQDDLLRGLYDDWLQPKREQYRQRLADALSRLAATLEERREFASAIRHAERLVAHDPLREAHHQMLIRLYAATRDRASALRAYHQCMRVLRRELGVEPCTATRELFERVLKSEPAEGLDANIPPAMVPPSTARPFTAPPSTVAPPRPMVGRKTELERLTAAWSAAARGGIHLAVILGEPGIGKSRLAEELYASCGRPAARTRCYAGQGRVVYAPIADWLRTEPLRAARPHLSQPQLQELARVLPELLEEHPEMQRPHPLTEGGERIHFYDSLNAAFTRARKPLLLWIDDLQWCDADSFEWLHSLFRLPAAEHILVLGTARAEEVGRDHPLTWLLSELRQTGQAVEIPLSPLDAEDTAALALQVAGGGLAVDDLSDLYRATQGNPLFVVESVRAGHGRQPQPRNATSPRIHAVISARLAQLSKSAYELAGMAGAIGRSFSFDLLAKATDWDEDSLSRALDELWQRRIIEGHGLAEYDFTHDRLREVAYAELSLVRRRFLHRRLARALGEAQGGEPADRSAEVAAHYEAAGMAEEAIDHYFAAAAVARQRYADAEAAGLLRRAIALCREFPETAPRREQELELLVTLGVALVTTQGYAMPEVGQTYERALTLSRRLCGKPHIFPVLSGAWGFHIVSGQIESSRELGQEFLELADTEGVAALSGAGHLLQASSLFHLGRFAESRRHAEQALSNYVSNGLSNSLGNDGGPSKSVLALFAGPDIGVFCRSYLAHLLWHFGYADQAASSSDAAIAAAREVRHPFSMAIALSYAAMLHAFRRERGAAGSRADEAVALCQTHNFPYYLAMAEILAGWGKGPDGLAQLRQGLDHLKATGAEIRLPFYYGLLAENCAAAGQSREALANIANAFAFQSKNGELWAVADLHRLHGDLLLEAGSAEQARASYQRALAGARETGARMIELRAAVRLQRMGEGEALGRLYPQFTEGFETVDLVEARTLMGKQGKDW